MMNFTRYKKHLAIILIPALLSCGGPGHKGVPLEQYDLSLRRAMNIDWSEHQVQLVEIDGTKHSGYLDGWTQNGFIIENKNHIDTVAYSNLRDYLLLHTGKTNTNKGFYYGLAGGVGLAAIAGWIVIESDGKNNSAPAPDNPPPLDDIRDGDNAAKAYIILIGVPVVLAVSAAVGSIIGSESKKYERYYFKADEFKANPWQFKAVETRLDLNNLDDLE